MFQVSTFEARTLLWWYSKRKEIDFTPPYQRKGGRWKDKDQAYLIDSIINGFDIPKIYLTDFTFYNTKLNQANRPYAVIDGKQRLGAIIDFIQNKLPLNKDIKYYKNPELQIGGLTYSQIKKQYPDIASDFDNFNLSVMRVITDDDRMIEELFLRLNRSQPLTGAENRNAINSPVVEAIRDVCSHKFFTKRIAFSKKKGEDANLAAKIIYLESLDDFGDLKKSNLDKLARDWQDYDFDYEKIKPRIFEVLEALNKIFMGMESFTKAQGEIPVYYMFIRDRKVIQPKKAKKFFTIFEDMRLNFDSSVFENEPEVRETVKNNYAEYNVLRRSANDQSSLKGRLRILNEHFELFERMGLLK